MCLRVLPVFVAILCFALCASERRANAEEKERPKVAVFPLAGNAKQETRDQVVYALRAKLDRQGTYEPIDGPTMSDLATSSSHPISLQTPLEQLKPLVEDHKPAILIWGNVDQEAGGLALTLKIVDLREKEGAPRQISKRIAQPTDLRFAIEQVLETLPGVGPFAHPSEQSFGDTPEARRLWQINPNLVPRGDFADGSDWTFHYRAQKYAPKLESKLPLADGACVYRVPPEAGEKAHHALAMNLSRDCAESDGLACLSGAIAIQPHTRYRLQFRYRSDGPIQHVFVKGYAKIRGAQGQMEDREVYRRQVPPSGATAGKWVTMTDDFVPRSEQGRNVEALRVDLYAYAKPGTILFDSVELKAIGSIPASHEKSSTSQSRPSP